MIKYRKILIFLVALSVVIFVPLANAQGEGVPSARTSEGELGKTEKCEHADHDHSDHAEISNHVAQSDHADHNGHDHSVHSDDVEVDGNAAHSGHGDHADHDGHEVHDHSDHPWYVHDCEIFSPDDPNIGGFLFPSFHAFGSFGNSSIDQEELASGHHDPQGPATLQSLEPSIALQKGNLRGLATGSGYTSAEGEFTFVLEEGFLKLVALPGGTELRGGQFLNRFGFQNAVHNHDWNFVDQNLVNGRFLNEGELTTQGGEIAVPIPWAERSRVVASFGGVAVHGGHEHEEEDELLPFEAEGAEFRDRVFGVSWESELRFDDRRSVAMVASGLWGDNAFARQTQVYGVGLEYRVVDADRSLRLRSEIMFREVDAVSGHLPGESEEEEEPDEQVGGLYADGDFATFDEFGFSSAVLYSWNQRMEVGVRADWVSGINEMGLDDRFRVSPMLTWYANPERTVQCRLQYNHDIANDFGSANSIWFQVGFNWGGGEVH